MGFSYITVGKDKPVVDVLSAIVPALKVGAIFEHGFLELGPRCTAYVAIVLP